MRPLIVLALAALAFVPGVTAGAATPGAAVTATPVSSALRERAAAGDALAQYDLGIALLCGRPPPPDPVEAARWMALAAEQGLVSAQSVYGWMLMTGAGLTRDDAQAGGWLRKAAERGNTAAQNNLGLLHVLGQGVAHDHAEAERWFSAAAAKGAAEAIRNLRVLREAGPGATGATRAAASATLRNTSTAAVCGGRQAPPPRQART